MIKIVESRQKFWFLNIIFWGNCWLKIIKFISLTKPLKGIFIKYREFFKGNFQGLPKNREILFFLWRNFSPFLKTIFEGHPYQHYWTPKEYFQRPTDQQFFICKKYFKELLNENHEWRKQSILIKVFKLCSNQITRLIIVDIKKYLLIVGFFKKIFFRTFWTSSWSTIYDFYWRTSWYKIQNCWKIFFRK